MKNFAFEDVYYDHCSYFSPGSLARSFSRNGFDVLDIWEDYDGQYIMLEAKPGREGISENSNVVDDLKALTSHVDTYQKRFKDKISRWSSLLDDYDAQGRKIVLWGSGSKAVAFLRALKGGPQVEYVVDINPHRQGTYMAGTGQFVVSPDYLKGYQPDVVVIMNSIYLKEIRYNLEKLELAPTVMAL